MEIELNTGDKVAFSECLAHHSGAWLRRDVPSLGDVTLVLKSHTSTFLPRYTFPVEMVAFPGMLSNRLTAWLNRENDNAFKDDARDRYGIIGTSIVDELLGTGVRVVADHELALLGWLSTYGFRQGTGRHYYLDIMARLTYCPVSEALLGVEKDNDSAAMCVLIQKIHDSLHGDNDRRAPIEHVHTANLLEELCLDVLRSGKRIDVALEEGMHFSEVSTVVLEALWGIRTPGEMVNAGWL